MNILSIERAGVDHFILWIEDGNYYKNIEIDLNNAIRNINDIKVSKYKNYTHFAEVMGKFNPWTIFRIEPIPVQGELDFEECAQVMSTIEKEIRDFMRETNA